MSACFASRLSLSAALDSGTVFSNDHMYRYRLWRRWSLVRPIINFCLLNPSEASAERPDALCLRLELFARQARAGGYSMTNCFAFVASDPEALYVQSDPVGPENDAHILGAAREAGRVVIGWGSHAQLLERSAHVLALLEEAEKVPLCFERSRSGEPEHPLVLSGRWTLRPYPFRPH